MLDSIFVHLEYIHLLISLLSPCNLPFSFLDYRSARDTDNIPENTCCHQAISYFTLLSSLWWKREEDFSHIIGCLDPNKFTGVWTLILLLSPYSLQQSTILECKHTPLQVIEITGRNNTPEKENQFSVKLLTY